MALAGLKETLDYFGKKEGQTLSDLRKEWMELSEDERTVLREGIGNGSYTY
jgi:hypothetical protein